MARLPTTSWFVNPPKIFYGEDDDYLTSLKKTLTDISRLATEISNVLKNNRNTTMI